jgi:hypothetical protein
MFYKKIIILFVLFISSILLVKPTFAATTPGYGYTYTVGSTDFDQGMKSTVDKFGNIYYTGFFYGTDINFNTTGQGSPDLHTSNGFGDIFITKINANGSYGWTYTMGNGQGEEGFAITTDSNGNIYLTADFNGTNTNFNTTGHGSPDLKTSGGNGDIAITKFNADGSYGWTYVFGGTGNDGPQGITTDPSNNVYIVGFFSSSNVDFNGTGSGSPDIKSPNGASDMFIQKN